MTKKSLKIGIDARMFSDAFTGIGRYNYELTKRLFKQTSLNGRSLEWVIFLNEPQFSEFDFPASVKKVLVDASHYSWMEQTKFLKLLNQERCDLVHFTHFNLPLLYRRPFVVTIHDTTISFYPGKKMNVWWRKLAYQLVIRHAVKVSRHIITVSEHTKKDVLKLFRVRSQKISPIHIAPSSEFKPSTKAEQKRVKQQLGLADTFLLYTGNWREHKNLVGLIEAFAQLQKKHPSLQLVVTGKEDPHYPEVKQAIEKLGLTSAIKLVGLVDFNDLVALFGSAKLYVCPSFYEGFGLPPLEAMACATPVAVSRAASLPEVCGKSAVYFDPHDTANMAQVMLSLLEDEQKLTQLSEQGPAWAGSFSWDKCAAKTLQTYQSVL